MPANQFLPVFGVIVAFAAFSQGFMGLGFGIITIAGVGFLPWDLERATVIINLLLIVLNSTIIYAGRKDFRINWKLVGVILAGEVFGVPLGYWFIFTFGNKPVFRLALGVVLIIFVANQLLRPTFTKPLHLGFGVVAGVLGGFLAGGFTAAGPPLALFIYSQYRNAADAKGTLQVVFMAATLWRLLNIVIIGRGITLELIKIAGLNFVIVVAFAVLGHWVTYRIPNYWYVKIVYSFIGVAGILYIIKALA
jgi:uncharacterized membrane protein YfcA